VALRDLFYLDLLEYHDFGMHLASRLRSFYSSQEACIGKEKGEDANWVWTYMATVPDATK